MKLDAPRMPLEIARGVGREVLAEWSAAGFLRQAEIAGSIRRERPEVHDVDLVVIPEPKRLGDFRAAVRSIWRKGGSLIWTLRRAGIQIDVYFAMETSWATVLLIRTGSKEHNIALCRRARARGLKLHAGGDGLEAVEPRHIRLGTCWLPCLTEAAIFDHLELPYREPWEREVP